MNPRELRLVRRLVSLARNSPWILIAVGLHVIVAAVLSVVFIRHEKRAGAATDTHIAVAASRPPPPETLPPVERLDRQRIPENQLAELVPHEHEQTFVPTELAAEEDLYSENGEPSGAEDGEAGETGGTSIGVGSVGHHGAGVSPFVSTRLNRSGTKRLGSPRSGAKTGTEETVLEGLRWLLRHQNEDGSWGANTLVQHCNPETPCVPPEAELDSAYDVGLTGLALLAFLGQGLSIGSRLEIVDPALGRKHNAGRAVQKGIRWLLERQDESGSFSGAPAFRYPENETLSTMVLCEAYGLSRNRELEKPAQRAIDFLVAAQKRGADGELSGWGSGSRADIEARLALGELDPAGAEQELGNVDLAVTCWVVMALESARLCGFDVPAESLRGALAYTVQATSGDERLLFRSGGAGADPGAGLARHPGKEAALGMLVRAFLERDLDDPYLARGAERIVRELPAPGADPRSLDFYYWYFATLALNQFDGPDSPRRGAGEYWEPWNEALVRALLALQDDDRRRGVCSRGGWLADTRGNPRGRALYDTALNTLTLEVYYRFENVFGAALRGAPGLVPELGPGK